MQDRIHELRVKLKSIKENPEFIRIVADMLDIPTKDSFIMIAKVRHKYLKELREISDKDKKEAEKQQKLF